MSLGPSRGPDAALQLVARCPGSPSEACADDDRSTAPRRRREVLV